jgi:DNA-binding CsgD family transcriptional regulator
VLTAGRRSAGPGPADRARTPTGAVLAAIALAYVAVFALRLLHDDPATGVTTLLVFPIALAAWHFGLRAGQLGAAAALALVFAWTAIESVDLPFIGYLTRGVLFLSAALGGHLLALVAAEPRTGTGGRAAAQTGARQSPAAGVGEAGLSERELEVLRLLALGHTNKEIAERLYISARTVESHRASIQQKTGKSGRAELVRYVLDLGLLERGKPAALD